MTDKPSGEQRGRVGRQEYENNSSSVEGVGRAHAAEEEDERKIPWLKLGRSWGFTS